jgi:hypothetical protein
MATHISDRSKEAADFARVPGTLRLLAMLPALLLAAVSAPAWGDIFKWTDEQGRINLSNVPPPASGKAKNIEIVLKEAKPASLTQHVATPTEQALLERIESLERQLQTRQYAPQAPAVPPATPYAGYYPPTPPPPPSSGYYASSYPGSYPGYYPAYTYPVASSYVVYPARTYLTQPVYLAPHGGFSHHGGGGHRGRR